MKQSQVRSPRLLISIPFQVTLRCRVNKCQLPGLLSICANVLEGGVGQFSAVLSHQPRWPLSWDYNSTMQCLPNLVFKQLCECVQGAGFPYCSNYGVELVFALLCFSTPQSPHWFWMGIKHQVAGSEMTKHHTDGRPLHQVCMAQTDYTIESNCHCTIFSRGMKGSSYTQQKKTTIQTNDTHTHTSDYVVIAIQAALPPPPRMKSRNTYDSLYWEKFLYQNCQW